MNQQPKYKILACGSNGNYQLGLGDDEDRNTLCEVETPLSSLPKSFAFGGNHTLILHEDGLVLAAGCNEYGQCGVKGPKTLEKFTKIPGKWKFIAAGWEHSVLVDEADTVYTCGHGPKGELGLGDKIVLAEEPFDVRFPQKARVVGVKSSINHVVVEREDGFYGWGSCRKGQLGEVKKKDENGKPLLAYWAPERLAFLDMVAAVGHDRTVLYDGQSISVLGKNPETIDALGAKQVKAMWSSVHWCERREKGIAIFSQGNNLHGQLYKYSSEATPVSFTVGSEHGLTLLDNGRVCAWGWGEHGNCGVSSSKSGDETTYDYLNEIYSGKDKVLQIAAGCATSWLVVESTEN